MSSVYERLRQDCLRALRDRPHPGGTEVVRSVVRDHVADYQARATGGDDGAPLSDPAGMSERLERSIIAFGPLTPFLDGSLDYEELIIHGDQVSYIDATGRLRAFPDPVGEAETRHVVDRLLADVGSSVDEANPMVQTQILEGGGRLGVVIPPISDRIDVTLRRYRTRRETFGELIEWDAIDAAAASLLAAAMQTPTGIVVTGQPGAGKTTIVNALLRSAPSRLRVIACEDTPEVSVDHLGGARWRTRPPGPDGGGAVTLRDLVRVSLGMRPELIVVGETRGPEALELTRAGNAGCGLLTTIHANSGRLGLQALVSTACMAGPNIEADHVRHLFGSIVDLVVHVARDPHGTRGGGRRQVMEVVAVSPLQVADHDFTCETIFHRERFGGRLRWTGAQLPAGLDERLELALEGDGASVQGLLEGRRSLC